MDKSEIVFVVLLVGGFLIPPAVFGLWWMFLAVLTFFACFGFYEWLAVKSSGRTISQKFWDFSKEKKIQAWILIVGWLVAWLALLWHFADKHLI